MRQDGLLLLALDALRLKNRVEVGQDRVVPLVVAVEVVERGVGPVVGGEQQVGAVPAQGPVLEVVAVHVGGQAGEVAQLGPRDHVAAQLLDAHLHVALLVRVDPHVHRLVGEGAPVPHVLLERHGLAVVLEEAQLDAPPLLADALVDEGGLRQVAAVQADRVGVEVLAHRLHHRVGADAAVQLVADLLLPHLAVGRSVLNAQHAGSGKRRAKGRRLTTRQGQGLGSSVNQIHTFLTHHPPHVLKNVNLFKFTIRWVET